MFRTICGNYFFGLGPLKNRTPGGSIRGNTVYCLAKNGSIPISSTQYDQLKTNLYYYTQRHSSNFHLHQSNTTQQHQPFATNPSVCQAFGEVRNLRKCSETNRICLLCCIRKLVLFILSLIF